MHSVILSLSPRLKYFFKCYLFFENDKNMKGIEKKSLPRVSFKLWKIEIPTTKNFKGCLKWNAILITLCIVTLARQNSFWVNNKYFSMQIKRRYAYKYNPNELFGAKDNNTFAVTDLEYNTALG